MTQAQDLIVWKCKFGPNLFEYDIDLIKVKLNRKIINIKWIV